MQSEPVAADVSEDGEVQEQSTNLIIDRQLQGDFWPPQAIDHYSPRHQQSISLSNVLPAAYYPAQHPAHSLMQAATETLSPAQLGPDYGRLSPVPYDHPRKRAASADAIGSDTKKIKIEPANESSPPSSTSVPSLLQPASQPHQPRTSRPICTQCVSAGLLNCDSRAKCNNCGNTKCYYVPCAEGLACTDATCKRIHPDQWKKRVSPGCTRWNVVGETTHEPRGPSLGQGRQPARIPLVVRSHYHCHRSQIEC